MSDEERDFAEEPDSSEIELETARLMDKAIKKESSVSISKSDGESETPTTTQIDITFQRLQGRVFDLLGSIEDALKNIEPSINERAAEIMERVSKQLQNAGLGVFANRAIKLANDEIKQGFAAEALLAPVYESIEKGRQSVQDIMTKAGRGAVRNVGHSQGNLQARLIQMYANIGELDKRLEATRAELVKWRGRASELEERIRQREELMGTSSDEMIKFHKQIADLGNNLDERDSVISSLKGELGQAQSQIEQQKQLIASIDSLEKIAADFDAKSQELSEAKGQIIANQSRFKQKEVEISSLKGEIQRIRNEKERIEDVLASSADEMASLRGAKQGYDAEISTLKMHVNELKTRWDALYTIAEDEPAFKAYFLVADKTQWFQLTHLSSALGIHSVLLKRQMQKFIDAGLLEMEGDKIRARSLSELAREAEGLEAKMIEDAKAEIGIESTSSNEKFDPKDLVMPTPEHTGPDDGDYKQEGR
jgi:predicted  nucleic acid-binding Zn-ribbon protein